MSDIAKELRRIGDLFRGRLPDSSIDDALDYIRFNEAGLALETLGDHLDENEVRISRGEWDAIFAAAKKLGVTARLQVLEQLVDDSLNNG